MTMPGAAVEDDAYDPFEAFDHALGADRVRNPFPKFAELRREAGVHEGNLWMVFGLHDPAAVVFTDAKPYSALSYDAVTQILKDSTTFSSQGYANTMGIVMGHTILEMDPPEHAGYRALLEQAFSRRAMERWEAEIIRPMVHRFIDAFIERGSADLVRELTFPFPIHVITGMLGLPEEDLPQFHRWAIELINVGADPPRGLAASQKLHDYLVARIEEKRKEPQEDLISVLAHSEVAGHRLNDEEIVAFLRLLLPAGGETTYRSSSNLIFGLLTHTDQLDALRADRSLLPQALEEGLRWEGPLTLIMRMCAKDTEVCGVPVPEGAFINVSVGAANHDESRWDNPDEFDIFRKRFPHVAFGFGPHVCLGQHLARMETTVAINALLDRLPNLRLDPEAVDPHISGLIFRSPVSLPVVFG
jgi:cytochrome P450